jgi:hypothetical protein
MAENGAGIVGIYLDKQAAMEEWLADQESIDKGERVKQLLREIKAAQPNVWKLFLANVSLDDLIS